MPPASGVGPTRRPGAKRGGRLQVEGSRSRTEAGGTWRCRPRCLQVCPRGEMAVPTNGRRHRVPAAPRPPAVPGCRRAALLQVAGPSHRRHDLGLLSRLWRFCLGSCSCSRSMRTRLPHHRLLPCVSLARPWPSAPMEPRWLSPVFVLTRNRDLQGSLPFHLLCPSVLAGVRSWLNQVVVTHPPPSTGLVPCPPPKQRHRGQMPACRSTALSVTLQVAGEPRAVDADAASPPWGGETVSFLPALRGGRGGTPAGSTAMCCRPPRGAGDVPKANAAVSLGVAVTSVPTPLPPPGSPGTPGSRAPREWVLMCWGLRALHRAGAEGGPVEALVGFGVNPVAIRTGLLPSLGGAGLAPRGDTSGKGPRAPCRPQVP